MGWEWLLCIIKKSKLNVIKNRAYELGGFKQPDIEVRVFCYCFYDVIDDNKEETRHFSFMILLFVYYLKSINNNDGNDDKEDMLCI